MNATLPQEMQQHTYAIMDEVEGSHWWFVGRRAILESFLTGIAEKLRTPQSTLRILDVGCGTGANIEMLSRYGKAEGVDVSDDALEFCRKRGRKAQKGLAETLPYADETFDLTTALDVVEHLDDDLAGLKEMYRVTKSGGYSLIFVPAFMFFGVCRTIFRTTAFGTPNHRLLNGLKRRVTRSNVRPTPIGRFSHRSSRAGR